MEWKDEEKRVLAYNEVVCLSTIGMKNYYPCNSNSIAESGGKSIFELRTMRNLRGGGGGMAK